MPGWVVYQGQYGKGIGKMPRVVKRESYRDGCARVLKDIEDRMHRTGTLKSSTVLKMAENEDGWYVDMVSVSGDPMTGHTLSGVISKDIKGAYAWVQGYCHAVYQVTGVTHFKCAPR